MMGTRTIRILVSWFSQRHHGTLISLPERCREPRLVALEKYQIQAIFTGQAGFVSFARHTKNQ